MRKPMSIAAATLAIATLASTAQAQSGGPYALTWNSFDGGGTTICAGGTYALGGTIAQVDAGRAVGGAYFLQGGFWNRGSTPTDADPPPDLTTGGGPLVFRLHGNAPNPFVASTTIAFSLGHAARTEMQIYDLAGRQVRTVLEAALGPGRHQVVWDGRDQGGHRVAEGVYMLRLQAGDFTAKRKLVVLR